MKTVPVNRHLRGYAFDPSLSLDVDTYDVNNINYKICWEAVPEDGGRFGPGPVGEYVEVIDYDPTTRTLYAPVDLNAPHILATQGLAPSESNPQFHQQMVYAVTMLTIQNFETALGRKIHWAPRLLSTRKYEAYVPRLRIYPHALREANAYYSPQKKAILFGYFAATTASVDTQMPGSLVFTCLSHDIIAHEVTHAILDGMHRNYNRATNPDVLAFHEAFADIVALFQHFTFPDVLKHQIAKTRGDLEKQNLLGQLAKQFGTAIGQYGSLRDALGHIDPETQQWVPAQPNPTDYQNATEPHARGSILVAAVFDAFFSVYKRRIRDLLRIATSGTGVLPEGDLHPDLVNRLANEASKTARHVLRMCIRALDYCPPVDITFGDYLRAIITADCDTVAEDTYQYRLAFIDAFRRHGIYPERIRTLSEESLRYPRVCDDFGTSVKKIVDAFSELLLEFRKDVISCEDREELYETTSKFIAGSPSAKGFHAHLIAALEASIGDEADYGKMAWDVQRLTGLVIQYWEDYGIRTSKDRPSFQVLDLHIVSRSCPSGAQVNQIVFGLVQRMGVVPRSDGGFDHYVPPTSNVAEQKPPPEGGFEVQGGCTLIFDLDRQELKYAVAKPLLDPVQRRDGWPEVNSRVMAQAKYQRETLPLSMSDVANYFVRASTVISENRSVYCTPRRLAMPEAKKIDSVAIHMYTMGTGDCFVLKFMKANTVTFKMLIDCGVWSGTFARIREFVKTLKQDVDNHVHALVVTHEHKDHVYGFQAAKSLFADGTFKADRVWMGWSEDDDDDNVKEWKKAHGQKKRALALAAQKLTEVVQSDELKQQFAGSRSARNLLGLRSQFSDVLDDFADLHVSRAAPATGDKPYVGAMDGMRVVKEEITTKDKRCYFSPGDIIKDQDGLEGVKIFVLGPPTLFENAKKEHGGDGESFDHNKYVDEDDLMISALNQLDDTNSSSSTDPFDKAYVSTCKEDAVLYDEGDARRRIDYDWIFSSGQFALRMNSLTNNLSLALAFEFESSGKVMLFPGDAEFGSWKSWHDIEWGQKGETSPGSRKALTTENLLNRTVFYKVAHHLSHNGTAKSVGLDMMTHPDLVAMATLDYEVISNGWKSTMPNQLIVKQLLEQTKGRMIVMNDKNLLYDRKRNITLKEKIGEYRAKMTPSALISFREALDTSHEHFIEYKLKV